VLVDEGHMPVSVQIDQWELEIIGSNGFERSCTLEGSGDEHRPEVIRVILAKMLPGGGVDGRPR